MGTQSLAVTIRVLMDENLTGKQKFQLVVKEVKTGSLNGSTVGHYGTYFVSVSMCICSKDIPGWEPLESPAAWESPS